MLERKLVQAEKALYAIECGKMCLGDSPKKDLSRVINAAHEALVTLQQ